jgi:hypothetical protein
MWILPDFKPHYDAITSCRLGFGARYERHDDLVGTGVPSSSTQTGNPAVHLRPIASLSPGWSLVAAVMHNTPLLFTFIPLCTTAVS